MERNKDDGWNNGCNVFADAAPDVPSLCRGEHPELLAQWISAHASRDQLSGAHDSIRQLNALLLQGASECGCLSNLGEILADAARLSKRTGESAVYQRNTDGLIVKVKDPFAKLHLKGNRLDGLLYEHQAHNLMFRNAAYDFLGIANDSGNARIVLAQRFIAEGTARPADSHVTEFFTRNGFIKQGFYYSDGFVSITDAMGDNVLMSEDGEMYFIDPIIRFDKEVPLALEHLKYKFSAEISYRASPADNARTAPANRATRWTQLLRIFRR